jgi:uncharacterized protein (TIGR00255 family)
MRRSEPEEPAMIRSMTGFGTASAEVSGAHYAVEVRSLNSKYFKALIRLPEELQGLEAVLEPILARRLTRGSVFVAARFSDSSADAAATINASALERYLQQLLAVPGLNQGQTRIDIGALLVLPGVLVNDAMERRLEEARQVLPRLVEEACDKVLVMRAREGRTLHGDLHRHCGAIAEELRHIATRVPVVVQLFQERLRVRMNALLAESGTAVREEDLIREVAIYAERSDIAEEVSRLQGHLEQFAEIIDADDTEPAGRTLDFLSQEMLREINTIGSKCLDVEVSRRSVAVKGAIDRIKEQAQNVE